MTGICRHRVQMACQWQEDVHRVTIVRLTSVLCLSVHAVHRAEGKQTRLPSSDVVREIGRVLQLVSWGNAKGVSTRCHQG